jgi:hypothetical protein
MWIFDWLPFWVFHLIILAGLSGILVSFFLDVIPFISIGKLPIQVVSVIILLFGVYMEGSISNQKKWEARVAELETKVIKAEADSKVANAKLKTVYIDRVKILKEKQIVLEKQIVEVANKIDAKCEVTPEVINILNEAAGVKK